MKPKLSIKSKDIIFQTPDNNSSFTSDAKPYNKLNKMLQEYEQKFKFQEQQISVLQ